MASRPFYHHLQPEPFPSPAMSDMYEEHSPALKPEARLMGGDMTDIEIEGLKDLRRADTDLKQRIRRLRIITRTLALLLSIAAFIPLALTLHKFLSTRNDVRNLQTVSGNDTRTAWAAETRAWPTYMYFSISLASLLLNATVIISYLSSIKTANITARIGTVFTALLILMDVAIWLAAVIIYKVEKDQLTDNKHTDIWGWTCSGAAREIQAVFTNVPFDQYCNIQTAGWVAGLLEVVLLGLSGVVYWHVWRRNVSKEKVRKRTATAQLLRSARDG